MNGCGSTERPACAVAAILAALVVLIGGIAPGSAEAAEFEVSPGHLSASVRDIVESYDWSLVWAADEDRVVDHPFVIGNGSLREALTDLLVIYRGQFVADMYEGNRVVLIDSAPPRIRVVLPGTASGGDQVAVGAPSPVAATRSGATLRAVDAADSSSSDPTSIETGEPAKPAESLESADVSVALDPPGRGLASRRLLAID